MGFFAIMRPNIQTLLESNGVTEFGSLTIDDPDPSELLFEISQSDEGFWWQVSAVLSSAGLTMTRRRSHDYHRRLWILRVTSQTNLRKKARELANFIRYRFKYSGIAIEKGSLSLSLEGKRGLAVFILAEQPKLKRVTCGKQSAVNSRSYLDVQTAAHRRTATNSR